jgi:hypothetical protein
MQRLLVIAKGNLLLRKTKPTKSMPSMEPGNARMGKKTGYWANH